MEKGAGYGDADVLGCQFSVYPLRQADIDTPVQAVIQRRGRDGRLGARGQPQHADVGQ